MHSSTSSSEKVTPSVRSQSRRGDITRRSIFAILAGLFIIWAVAEVGTMLAVHRVSKIMRRITQEYRESEQLEAVSAQGTPTMLLLGNSLLLEGVDYPRLRNAMSDEYDVHRLVFEQTGYLDEYYVLRKLFRHGARPHDVVLCLSMTQLIGNGTRGDFMSKYMDALDIASLGSREHMDATTVSSLMFAHWSDWFAYRAETRKAILGAVMPDLRDLAVKIAWNQATPLTPEVVRAGAIPRINELKELCDEYGSHLTILIPPTMGENHADALASVSKDVGVRVLVPVQPGVLDASFFRDEYHLNPTGAALFTAKLQSQLATTSR